MFAYADPPYFGYARFYDHPESAMWNDLQTHRRFIAALSDWFPDGWALSMTSGNLQDLLPLCPPRCAGYGMGKTFRLIQEGS